MKLTLRELKKAINNAKSKINLKETKLPKSKTKLSPSIFITGKDIEKIVDKNSKLGSNVCLDCCQLAGHYVNCRTFNYKGRSYNYIPKEMILEAIKISSRTK